MFKQSVSSTMLTSDAANIFFPNITGDMFGNDNTFLATVRALVAPRMPEGESIHVSFGRSDYSSETVSDASERSVVDAICSRMCTNNGQIYIHNLAHRDEASNIANMEILKRKFCEFYKGWQYHEKISTFYQKSFKVICFINPESKSASLFVEQLNLQKLHYLQMSILAFLPWYFDPEKGMSETEMALVYSLRERTPEKYEACIEEIAKQYDFEAGRIRQLLQGFETRFEKMECENVRNEISRVDRRMNDLDRQYSDYIRQRNDLCIRLIGLQRKIEEGTESELMEYFLCNRKLVLESIDGTCMSFAVRDYLSYFDEDAAATYIKNKNGYFYRTCGSSMTKDGMEKLLNAIFIDQTLKIRFCAAYYFDMSGSVSAQSGHRFGPEFKGYLPNPHIDRFSCMGNYKPAVNTALRNRDYITALEQCIASAKSLNFHDSTVMEYFISQFTSNGGSSYKAIELPDGTIVSPKEAIKWIEEQEAAASTADTHADPSPTTESAVRVEVPENVAEHIAEAEAAGAEDAAPVPF